MIGDPRERHIVRGLQIGLKNEFSWKTICLGKSSWKTVFLRPANLEIQSILFDPLIIFDL
jgi:hypothetical protein